jgi:hypothetical protein
MELAKTPTYDGFLAATHAIDASETTRKPSRRLIYYERKTLLNVRQ